MGNHLNESIGIQHMFEICKLTPSVLTNNIIDDELDLRSRSINLLQINSRIIDRHKNWNVLLFKEAIKTKEIKLILNNGFESFKGITTVLDLGVCQLITNWYLTKFIVLHFC